MNVIYHHYGITECYNSIKKWKKKTKQTPGQSVAQCGSSGFKNKRCPEMCDWIQGQQNANSINAFIIQELVPDWPTTKYWRLCATGTKTLPQHLQTLLCV